METNIDIISFGNKHAEAGYRVCYCFWKKEKRTPNVALKVCICWLIEIQRDGTKTLSFPRSNGKLCYKNAEMKLRCKRNTICWPTKTTPKGLVKVNEQTQQHLPYATIISLVTRKRRIPLGEDTSKCSLCDRFWTSSAMSFSTGVETLGSWYHHSIARRRTEVYVG